MWGQGASAGGWLRGRLSCAVAWLGGTWLCLCCCDALREATWQASPQPSAFHVVNCKMLDPDLDLKSWIASSSCAPRKASRRVILIIASGTRLRPRCLPPRPTVLPTFHQPPVPAPPRPVAPPVALPCPAPWPRRALLSGVDGFLPDAGVASWLAVVDSRDKDSQDMWEKAFGFRKLGGRDAGRVSSEFPLVAGYHDVALLARPAGQLAKDFAARGPRAGGAGATEAPGAVAAGRTEGGGGGGGAGGEVGAEDGVGGRA